MEQPSYIIARQKELHQSQPLSNRKSKQKHYQCGHCEWPQTGFSNWWRKLNLPAQREVQLFHMNKPCSTNKDKGNKLILQEYDNQKKRKPDIAEEEAKPVRVSYSRRGKTNQQNNIWNCADSSFKMIYLSSHCCHLAVKLYLISSSHTRTCIYVYIQTRWTRSLQTRSHCALILLSIHQKSSFSSFDDDDDDDDRSV